MAHSFDCPKCGAPISLQPQPGDETVECPYCHETVILPAELRIPLPPPVPQPQVPQPQLEYYPQFPAKKPYSAVKLVIFVSALTLLIAAGIAIFFISNIHDPSTDVVYTGDTPTPALSAADSATSTADANAVNAAFQAMLKTEQAWPASLTEPFTDNSHKWTTGDVRDSYITGNRSISSGTYTWKITTVQSASDFTFPDMADQQDFYASVDMKLVNMPDDPEADAGMALRNSSTDDTWYYFSVNASGQYYFGWYNGTDWETLIPDTDSATINVGETNHLAVGVQGSQFIFLINGQMVDHFIDDNLKSGTIGLGINLPQTDEKATIEFSNFTVLSPAQNP